MSFIGQDTEFEDRIIKSVYKQSDGGWSIERDDGWHFYVPADSPIEPKVGDTARFYGKGIGYDIRGLYINNVKVYYWTEAEERDRQVKWLEDKDKKDKENFEKNKANYYTRIAALPDIFQKRIKKFQDTNPDFDWKFGEYELFCCEQAIVIANSLKTEEAILKWKELPYYIQKKLEGFDGDNHSGNTFSCAVGLARLYVTQPEYIEKSHGALTPLVGCKEYGCPHQED